MNSTYTSVEPPLSRNFVTRASQPAPPCMAQARLGHIERGHRTRLPTQLACVSGCWLVNVADDCAAELEATAVDPPGGGAAEPEAPDAIVTTGAEGASTPSDRTVIIASGSDSTSVREKRS